ncbi:PaaX family transcriptional regulator C-terminal domain-containing protein [Nocardia sp. NPDC050799]|uniref:PaaX family transcriptional regulator n=1 Tax=Nocardia sp. NPDC050799 TaxID=3154842 RepID=UPI003410873A
MVSPVQDWFLEDMRARLTEGTRARQMLITLMADYWLAEGALAPSGVLVDLMGDFGVSVSGSRTLLSRLTKEGRLVAVKEGRRTFYRLSGQTRVRLAGGLRRIADFGDPHRGAAGRWTCIAFSVPEQQRAVRQQLRKGLSWLGFAPLYDGLWITPRPVARDAESLVVSLGVGHASVFEGSIDGIGGCHGKPTDAWDIEGIAELYGEFLTGTSGIEGMGGADPAEALVLRTELVNVWRSFPRIDPDLPLDLLPPNWLRTQAQASFVRTYDALAPAAMRRVRGAVDRIAPDYGQHVAAHILGTRIGAMLS